MRSLRRRIERAEVRAAEIQASRPEEPAMLTWCRLLKIFETAFTRMESSPANDILLARIRRTIALIEECNSPPMNALPCAQLEYFCNYCILRLSWTGAWVGRELAFAEDDYDGQIDQIEKIERGKFAQGKPGVWDPVTRTVVRQE